MVSFNLRTMTLSVSVREERLKRIVGFFEKNIYFFLIAVLSAISIFAFLYYLDNGLGLAYNDARSHLDIGRRVVEGLKPEEMFFLKITLNGSFLHIYKINFSLLNTLK